MTDEAPHAGQVSPAANGSAQSGGLLDELSVSLLGAIPALIAITTPEGEIDEITQSYHDYTGLTAEEARDWRTHQVIHPDDFERAMAVWGVALGSVEPMQNEMRLRRYDGIYRWHLVQGTPVRDAHGGVRCWLTVSVDIEDRKRAELHARYLAEATCTCRTSRRSSCAARRRMTTSATPRSSWAAGRWSAFRSRRRGGRSGW